MLTLFAAFLFLGHEDALPSAAQTQQTCQLHVWGARKSFPDNSKFAAPFALRGTYHADRSEPLSNINVTDPVLRLSRIADKDFAGYFAKNVPITVIRHSDLLDLSATKKSQKPISERSAGCHADLILSNLVDVEYPSHNTLGPVGAIIAAPAGLNMQITFRRFDASGKMVFSKKDGANGELKVPRSKWHIDPKASMTSIDDAVADGIRDFAKEHTINAQSTY